MTSLRTAPPHMNLIVNKYELTIDFFKNQTKQGKTQKLTPFAFMLFSGEKQTAQNFDLCF